MITGRSAAPSRAPTRSISRAVGGRQRARVRQRGGALLLVGLHEHDVQRQVEEGRARWAGSSVAASASSTRPAISAVEVAVRADFVSGATNGTWSISWSEPWPQRNCGARPPSTIIGELFLCADAIALMPFVTPGPAVSAATPGCAGDLRPALGRERGRGLVAHVDEVDALRATAVVDGEEVAAREREELGDAVRLQAPGDQQPAMRLLRLGLLVPRGACVWSCVAIPASSLDCARTTSVQRL